MEKGKEERFLVWWFLLPAGRREINDEMAGLWVRASPAVIPILEYSKVE